MKTAPLDSIGFYAFGSFPRAAAEGAVAMTLAGVPTAVALSGMDLLTMLQAPMTAFLPMTKPSS